MHGTKGLADLFFHAGPPFPQEEKAFTLEQLGRAAFDPEFAVQHGDASTEDLGLEDTPSVVDEDEDVRRRLREVWCHVIDHWVTRRKMLRSAVGMLSGPWKIAQDILATCHGCALQGGEVSEPLLAMPSGSHQDC